MPNIVFDQIIVATLRWEGGYVHDPDDPGGETKYGISQRAHPDIDIKNLTIPQASQIYRVKYWGKIFGDHLPPRVSMALFDFAVHSGVSFAVRRLQEVVGATADGKMGPRTLQMTWDAMRDADGSEIAVSLMTKRAGHMAKWMQRRPVRLKYAGGFMRRLVDITATVLAGGDSDVAVQGASSEGNSD